MRITLTSTGGKVLASTVLVGAAASVAGLGTFGTFTSTTSASAAVASGTVKIDVGAGAAAGGVNRLSVAATGLVPGDTVSRAVTLGNTGDQALAGIGLTTTASPSSKLDTDPTMGLQLQIDACSVPWTEAGAAPSYTYTCTGTKSAVLASRPVIGSTASPGHPQRADQRQGGQPPGQDGPARTPRTTTSRPLPAPSASASPAPSAARPPGKPPDPCCPPATSVVSTEPPPSPRTRPPGETHERRHHRNRDRHPPAEPGAPPVPAQASPSLSPVPRLLHRLARGLGNVLLLVVVLAFAGLAVGPHVLGYRTMTMLTGSMAPVINPGDVTVAVQEPTADLAVGQIISYQIPVDDHRVVSHRVVRVTHGAGGTVTVQTKGDHNAAADPWTATVSDSRVWTVRAVVPHLGDVIRALRGPGLRIAFLYVGPALLVLLLLAEIWRSPRARPDEGPRRAWTAPSSMPPFSASWLPTSATPRVCARSSTCGRACCRVGSAPCGRRWRRVTWRPPSTAS